MNRTERWRARGILRESIMREMPTNLEEAIEAYGLDYVIDIYKQTLAEIF